MGVWRTLISGSRAADAQGLERRSESRATGGATLHLLAEHVLGLRLYHRVPVRERLQPVVPPRGPACRAGPRRFGRLPDMIQNPLHRYGLGDEGDDAHLCPAARADGGH